jgi:hypothetical protein
MADGTLYVTDEELNQIIVLSPQGHFIRALS